MPLLLETGLALLLTIEVAAVRSETRPQGLLWAAIHFLQALPLPCEVAQASLPEGETPHRVELRVPGDCRHVRSRKLADDPDERMGQPTQDSRATINAYCRTAP